MENNVNITTKAVLAWENGYFGDMYQYSVKIWIKCAWTCFPTAQIFTLRAVFDRRWLRQETSQY